MEKNFIIIKFFYGLTIYMIKILEKLKTFGIINTFVIFIIFVIILIIIIRKFSSNENEDTVPFNGPKVIKIGFLNESTGPIAKYGKPWSFVAKKAAEILTAENDGYIFEVIEVDSACDGTEAATVAQVLVDAGVVGVVGAACSGASMGANAVLSAAGIPQISYASTSPDLSDDAAYPDFFRIVPSDAQQGDAMADMVAASGVTNPALIYINNNYGSVLVDAFESYWFAMGNTLSIKLKYEETTTDFSDLVGEAINSGCDSMVLASYSEDGAMIIETMAAMGATIPTFGGDGMAGSTHLSNYKNTAAADGLKVTKPRSASPVASSFTSICSNDKVCTSGLYTLEAYDALMMIGKAAMRENGANMSKHIMDIGQKYQGESGVLTFLENGDLMGPGYDIGTFIHIPTYGDYYNVTQGWDPVNKITDVQFKGHTAKIGFLNDATGPIAFYADGFTAASQIAIDISNIIGWSNGIQFEIVYADSGCDGTEAATAAQVLVDAGVVGVVGAACSGASMGANAVLSAAGIPQIAYASTSPALSDDAAYPDFFRVVPSDALQGQALSAVVKADKPVDKTVGLVHINNDYGSVNANAFIDDFTADGSTLCTTIGYEETTTDFSAAVQSMVDKGCTSAVLISYAADGAKILDEMASQGWSGQVYGGDGIADEDLAKDMTASVDGVIATKPLSMSTGTTRDLFTYLCAQSAGCAGGIYTAEAFDAVFLMAQSIFTWKVTPSATLSQVIMATSQGLEGASGTIYLTDNGDRAGEYCVGKFTENTNGNVAFTCNRSWDPIKGIYLTI